MSVVATVALVALLALASWFDVRERRVPNALTISGVALGLVLQGTLGWAGFGDGAAGVGLALLFSLPAFAMGVLGGGDVKLLAAVGAFLGASRLLGAAVLIALVGGLLALVEAARRGALKRSLANTYWFMRGWVLFGRAGVAPTLRSPGTLAVPYGVAIAAGTLMWWFFLGAAR